MKFPFRPGLELAFLVMLAASQSAAAGPALSLVEGPPNIVWITSEDNGPQLGAYGDRYANTPRIDRLAGMGLRYLNVWSCAPVCAPARTAIISGVYPTATGSEHMRSLVRLPGFMKMYPQFLREAGYYCSNNSKEDYNLEKPGKVWDDSSPRGHWRNRAAGQPFFAVFNHTVTHESQIRKRPHRPVHDPAKVTVPPYHPDTPAVREDWAQYHDKITEMDALVGATLDELAEAGLMEDTIVFYYGDHGAGMPRSKRSPYNSGLHVPLIIYVPEKFRHLAPEDYRAGATSDRLVSFVDLAPTLLSLVGLKAPEYMHGRAFMGKHAQRSPQYLHGFRGRMDERQDLIRSVRDKRYVYIRNYMPHRIYGQHIDYMFQTPTTREWKELYDQGKLRPPQTYFWETKPAEELYDLSRDPHEVNNLARSSRHQRILRRLRRAQQEFALEIRDVGFLPETEVHSRSAGTTPYEMGHDRDKYPLKEILRMAETAAWFSEAAGPAGTERARAMTELRQGLGHADNCVRYWAATGMLIRGTNAVAIFGDELRAALRDDAISVRIVAAEALGRYGTANDVERALGTLLEAARPQSGVYARLHALNAIACLGDRAARIKEAIAALPTKEPAVNSRIAEYVPRLVEKILADLP